MSNSELKNQTKSINYQKNLRRLLGWEDRETRILKKSAGILRGILKKSPVTYQREIRKEWEKRIHKLEKPAKR